jgi:hypothetical protein
MMLDGTGRIRPLFGIAGSFTLGDPEGHDVISSACARALCLVKTRTAIVADGREIEAPMGPAIFAFDADTTAWIYFPLVRQLARLEAGRLDAVPLKVSGEILSMRAAGTLEFAVRRPEGIWVVDGRNRVLDAIPASAGPVLLLRDGVLYASSSEITLRRQDASEIRFAVEGAESFSTLGEGYVQVRAGRTSYVVRTTRGRERMFQLPEPAP